jgi:hypothetical protein
MLCDLTISLRVERGEAIKQYARQELNLKNKIEAPVTPAQNIR